MKLEDIQAKRAARKAKAEAERKAQYELDLEELDMLEEKHGDSNVGYVEVAYSPGLPTLAVVRTPAPSELKRYRDRVREKSKSADLGPDTGKAAEELAAVCLVYPEADVFAGMLAARPGLGAQLGLVAIGLAVGDEGKG